MIGTGATVQAADGAGCPGGDCPSGLGEGTLIALSARAAHAFFSFDGVSRGHPPFGKR